MTQEEKDLLLKDLSSRLPYGVKVNHKGLIRPLFSVSPTQYYLITLDNATDGEHNGLELVGRDIDVAEFKPYLRSMSSMTEDERKEYLAECDKDDMDVITTPRYHGTEWLITNHFDYRGLIPMGLALEAPEGMYKTK